ncbi:MAG: hypothetical protein JRI23_16100 [Deltaproteobacteria bacterium]|jgi:hypothetical protein|nr:hypothetical protein [Deltaproteobacteria bacterium]MBW2533289.1 hypothetical protein [Deltaproteobacteria bacterium]
MGRLELAALPLCLALSGCPSDPPGRTDAAPSAAPSGPAASAATSQPAATAQAGIPKTLIAQTLNPNSEPPYAGPTGTLRGVIRVEGDPPPSQSVSIPPGCGAAAATYDKLFRVGQDDTLADVLVAVVGYRGYVPPKTDRQSVDIFECAYSRRTVALTFGQYLEVRNRDERRSYLPVLIGARLPAKLVVAPKQAVKLYAPKPQRYLLVDEMGNRHMKADVFVLKYPTFQVTGLDGRYEIRGIPVGEAQVSALLPAANMTVARRKVTIAEGDNDVDLTIEIDASKLGGPSDAGPPPDASAAASDGG